VQAKAAASFAYVDFAPPFSEEMEACGTIDDGYDYNLTAFKTLQNVGSATMCCAACAAYEGCGAWTWGAAPHVDWVTHVCWLKELPLGPFGPVPKVRKAGVMSGYPAPGVKKAGAQPPPPSVSGKLDGVVSKEDDLAMYGTAAGFSPRSAKCPGSVFIEGHGPVALINAGADTPGKPGGRVEALMGDAVVPHITGRTYFGTSCQEGPYDQTSYLPLQLLGKRISWTTDVSGTGCGCNAAMYLVSMPQNQQKGTCNDYYCDAMHVCGVECAEIDLQEANQYSWMSTMHTHNPAAGADGLGVARGFGGSLGEPERRDWTAEEYGPGARCVDTTRPFQVSVSFPIGADGQLASMNLQLSQAGQPCDLEAVNEVGAYHVKGHHPAQELTSALQAGMTPVISYWKSADMLWMDGLGADGRGPCVEDAPDWCPELVRFHGFSVEALPQQAQQ